MPRPVARTSAPSTARDGAGRARRGGVAPTRTNPRKLRLLDDAVRGRSSPACAYTHAHGADHRARRARGDRICNTVIGNLTCLANRPAGLACDGVPDHRRRPLRDGRRRPDQAHEKLRKGRSRARCSATPSRCSRRCSSRSSRRSSADDPPRVPAARCMRARHRDPRTRGADERTRRERGAAYPGTRPQLTTASPSSAWGSRLVPTVAPEGLPAADDDRRR